MLTGWSIVKVDEIHRFGGHKVLLHNTIDLEKPAFTSTHNTIVVFANVTLYVEYYICVCVCVCVCACVCVCVCVCLFADLLLFWILAHMDEF
jgi:hypothetical protein